MYYYSFSEYLKKRYGQKVRRISLNAGFPCPNKSSDGTEGCIFCNENGFSDIAGSDLNIEDQIDQAITRIKKHSGTKKFIAYFQNGAGTNAKPEELKLAYDPIKHFPEIQALFISTRPDCVDEEKLDLIASYNTTHEVWVEYGLQTVHDVTLNKMNRKHTFAQSVQAIKMTVEKGINVGVHVILGLPGETKEDMLQTAKALSLLPVNGIKLHVLHVLKNTELEKQFLKASVKLLTRDEYVELACDFLEYVRNDIVIMRLVSDAREEFLIAPKWINDKPKVINMINNEFKSRNTHQGKAL